MKGAAARAAISDMEKSYRLILFDCFNTLFLAEASRLPTIELDGRQVRSTAGLLRPLLAERYPDITEAALHQAMREAWRWSEGERGEEHREVPAQARIARLFHILELPPPEEGEVERLLAAHMAAVVGSYVFPSEHRALLDRLRGRFRLAIFSNFDYAPALLGLLAREGIETWFDPVVISAAIGYRKPGRAAFRHALEMVGEDAAHILFVGDSLVDDVAGARDVRLDVAWLNGRGETAPPELRPAYTLDSLTQVVDILDSPGTPNPGREVGRP